MSASGPPAPRPADAARQALRAARARAVRGEDQEETTTTPGPTGGGAVTGGGAGAGRHAGETPGAQTSGAEGTGDTGDARTSGPVPTRLGEEPRSGGTAAASAGSAAAGARGARPGDAARAALWRAVDARAAASPEEPPAERAARAPEAPRARGTAGTAGTAASGGARPGDVARAALRAARSTAERARAEAEAESTAKADATARTDAKAKTVAEAMARTDAKVKTVAEAMARTDADVGGAAPVDPHHGRRTGRHEGPGRSAARGEGPRPVRDVRAVIAGAFEPPTEDHAPTRDLTSAEAPRARSRARAESPVRGEALAGDRSGSHAVDHPGDPRSAGAAATPRVPGTMAAPSRDGELRRTFRAFPPRTSGGEAFAESWWGNAWVTALEEGALDAARLVRGRAYADKGHVDAITVTPGLVLAYVHGSRPRPYRVQVRLRTLDDDEWDRFLDTAAERPADIAALLDKELPQSLAGAGAGAGAGAAPASGGRSRRGARLLPGPGELEPHCSCPDRGHPCKHAAALCYQTARLLDEDPFVLLLLRGRGERELLDALSRRNAARAARAAQEQRPAALPGVRASEALAPRALPPLPAPLPPPPHPEQPPVYPGAPGGPDPLALDQLATDAAARAHALLTTGRDPVAELTLWQDAVRLAAARPGSGLTAATRALYSSLAAATGRTPADLARAVAAWRQGGLEGLVVLEEPWDPPAGRFDRARPLLLAADLPAFRPWRNHLTHPLGHVQLRLGRDGLWYAYESEPGHDDWWPRGIPDLDPVGALTGLGPTDAL
ncbi:SWIM zinc finger family protein [Streptomyces heilongjiangensis]|uniref:SWIM zinc finger family protein n=1 Tax=Streptomyces heilongjiangensis TaxID=945052 RepID=A0ABW1B7J5_9ACTN|nr:SWIM zinc finger family protein [Streptomyces heilongjiangensis]MDC2947615.1 SWIM zinc finger family protein [Streptomyces heilongjiangensis]